MPEPLRLKAGPMVAELCARYLTEYVAVRCKPSTAMAARSVVGRHILLALGKLPLAALGRAQAAELHQSLYGTPAVANMAVRILSSMYGWPRTGEWFPREFRTPAAPSSSSPSAGASGI